MSLANSHEHIPPELVPIKLVAKWLSISPSTVWRYAQQGILEGAHAHRHCKRLVTRESVARFVTERRVGATMDAPPLAGTNGRRRD